MSVEKMLKREHGAGLYADFDEAGAAMSRTKKGFKGDNGKRYGFVLETFWRGVQKIRRIVVKHGRKAIAVFHVIKGVATTYEAFETWAGAHFAIAKGSVMAFALAGFV